MKLTTLFAGVAMAIACATGPAMAGVTTTINPVSDGSLYICLGCNPNPVDFGGQVLVAGYIQGDVRFATSAIPAGQLKNAELTLSPSAWPVWGSEVQVYGYTDSGPTLSLADANRGTLLGQIDFANLYSGPESLDVTPFLRTNHGAYIGFDLISNGTDFFSAPTLSVTLSPVPAPAPEPSVWVLMMAGVGLLGAALRRRWAGLRAA